MGNERGDVLIRYDHRETRCGVPSILSGKPSIRTEQCALAVGDYDLGDGVLVERKQARDLLRCIEDHSLFSQTAALAEASSRAFVVIEDDIYEPVGKIPNVGRRAAITFLAVLRNVSVVLTRDQRETAEWLHQIAVHAQQGAADPGLRGPKGTTLTTQQEFFLQGLPRIGPQNAVKLLRRFGTGAGVVAASEMELAEVIGKKTAATVRGFLDAKSGHSRSGGAESSGTAGR